MRKALIDRAWNIRTAYAIVVISGLIPTAIAWWLGYSTTAIVLAFFSGVFAGVLAEEV